MAIFQFFKMGAVCHIGFVLRDFGPPMNSIWCLCNYAKFG